MMILEGGLGSEEASQQQRDQSGRGRTPHKLCPNPTMQVSELPDMQIVNCCSL